MFVNGQIVIVSSDQPKSLLLDDKEKAQGGNPVLFWCYQCQIILVVLATVIISQLPYKFQPCFIFLLSAASQIHDIYIHPYTFHAQFLYFERQKLSLSMELFHIAYAIILLLLLLSHERNDPKQLYAYGCFLVLLLPIRHR